MSHDSNSNTGKGRFVKRQTYLANLQAYQDPVEYHCGYIRMNFECLIMTDKKIWLDSVLPKSFIRWEFSRGNSCADPEGDREHERVKRGDMGPDSPLENDKLYGFL